MDKRWQDAFKTNPPRALDGYGKPLSYSERVLVMFPNMAYKVSVGTYHTPPNSEAYWLIDGEGNTHKVVHYWMPLPETP